MNQDTEHLRILAIFHYVCAGLAALFACFPIFYLVFGLLIALRPEIFNQGKNPPPAFLGWFMIFGALAFIFLGWIFAALLAWSGRCLKQRKHYIFCMVIAGLACLFTPFGTVLGVFTIIVLSRASVRALFEYGAQPPLVR